MSLSLVKFAVATSLVTFLIPAIVAIAILRIIVLLSGSEVAADQVSLPTASEAIYQFIALVVVSPLWEALVYHVLLLMLLARLFHSELAIVIVSAVLFSLMHVFTGTLAQAVLVFLPGIVWAFASLHWFNRTGSWKSGYMAACLSHAIHNLYYFVGGFIPAGWIL